MYTIEFPKKRRPIRSRDYETLDEPVNLIKELQTEGWAGTVRVVDSDTGRVEYSRYISSLERDLS